MAGDGKYVAIDWGTTNRRTYLMGDDGSVLDTRADDRGILKLDASDYEREVTQVVERLGVETVFIAGMAGSSRGWFHTPYVECPASAATVAAAMVSAPMPGVWMVPGIAQVTDAHCDVMRGEEVQILGATFSGLAPADALFCQPGTHNKWIHARAGQITGFETVMTGELFSLLRSHGILAGMLDGEVADTDAFREGVERGAASRSLGASLFEVRAMVLLEKLAEGDAAAFASGVLIGNDVAVCDDLSGQSVHLLSSGNLTALYRTAISQLGGEVVTIDSHAAFAAGIHLLREQKQ